MLNNEAAGKQIKSPDEELDESFKKLCAHGESKQTTRLILRKVSSFQERGLKNLCEFFGKVTDIYHRSNCTFVSYETISEACYALTELRQLKHVNFYAEFAHERPRETFLKGLGEMSDDLSAYEMPVKKMHNNWNPFEPLLQMDKRQIKGPFASPCNSSMDSLIVSKDYENPNLLKADPKKEFFRNSNDEYFIETDLDIFHGRKAAMTEATEAADSMVLIANGCVEKDSMIEEPCDECSVCKLSTDMYCEQNQKPYCSIECLALDKTPLAKANDDAIDAEIFEILPMELKRDIKITFVVNQRMLFVRPGGADAEAAFVKCINDTVKYAKKADNLKLMPQIGELVLAPFDNYYQRAMVLKNIPKENQVAVAFIDFGNIEVLELTTLKKISPELKQIKRFATKIILKGVYQDYLSDKALQYLYNLLVFDIELTVEGSAIENDIMIVDLRDKDYISRTLNALNSKEIVSKYEDTNGDRNAMIDLKINEGEHVSVLITDNSMLELCSISFIDKNDFDQFHKNEQKVQAICHYLFQKEECYTPSCDEYCVFQFGENKRWYRGQCLEIKHDGFATILFIDYGNMHLVEINLIRRIPVQLLFECITSTAILNGNTSTLTANQSDISQMKAKWPIWSTQVFERLSIVMDPDPVLTGNFE